MSLTFWQRLFGKKETPDVLEETQTNTESVKKETEEVNTLPMSQTEKEEVAAIVTSIAAASKSNSRFQVKSIVRTK